MAGSYFDPEQDAGMFLDPREALASRGQDFSLRALANLFFDTGASGAEALADPTTTARIVPIGPHDSKKAAEKYLKSRQARRDRLPTAEYNPEQQAALDFMAAPIQEGMQNIFEAYPAAESFFMDPRVQAAGHIGAAFGPVAAKWGKNMVTDVRAGGPAVGAAASMMAPALNVGTFVPLVDVRMMNPDRVPLELANKVRKIAENPDLGVEDKAYQVARETRGRVQYLPDGKGGNDLFVQYKDFDWATPEALAQIPEGAPTRVGDITSGELLEDFPDLGSVRVMREPGNNGGGAYSPTRNRITLRQDTDPEMLNTFVHEMQHAIQEMFDLPSGQNSSLIDVWQRTHGAGKRRLGAEQMTEVTALMRDNPDMAKQAAEQYIALNEKHKDGLKFIADLAQKRDTIEYRLNRWKRQSPTTPEEKQTRISAMNRLQKELDDAQDGFNYAKRQITRVRDERDTLGFGDPDVSEKIWNDVYSFLRSDETPRSTLDYLSQKYMAPYDRYYLEHGEAMARIPQNIFEQGPFPEEGMFEVARDVLKDDLSKYLGGPDKVLPEELPVHPSNRR